MTKVNDIISTEIKVKTIASDGTVLAESTLKNEVINEGVTVIARLLVDPSGPRPSHIYAKFAPTLSDAQGSSNLGLNNSLVNNLDFTPTENNSGCLREPIFSTVKVENNSGVVDGKLTFFFRITEDSELTGSFNTASSKIYYLGLAAARDIADYNQDLMVSLLSTDPAIEIPMGGQVAIDYTLKFSS